jgi:DNA-binding MarR family transcriptional regulator
MSLDQYTRRRLSGSSRSALNGARTLAVSKRPADNLLALVHVLSSLIDRAFYSQVHTRHGISTPAWRILLTLLNHPGATAVEINDRWAMEKMAVSRAIRQLEKKSWIRRVVRKCDRRSHELYLTPKGQAACRAILPDANARYREIVECLSAKELASLDRSLVKLILHTAQLVD